MFMTVYNEVVNIIGTVPPELEFIYAICTISLFIMIIYCITIPFSILYDTVGGKW